MFYFVTGYEQFTSPKSGVVGWIYYVSKNIAEGCKPAFRAYSPDKIPNLEVMDKVMPDIEEKRDGENMSVFVRGIFKIDGEEVL